MNVAVFDNLGNNAYEQVKSFRRLGVPADVVVEPLDTFVMSDPRWEDLDLELPTDRLDRAYLPEDARIPDWVRRPPPGTRDPRRVAGIVEGAVRSAPSCLRALSRGGPYAVYLAAVRSWVLRTLREYDVVFARGAGPAWCALAHARCIAQTYGGDITIAPFLDQPDFPGAEHTATPSPSREDSAVARLQRDGLQRSELVLLSDPRFVPFAERLGLAERSTFVPFVLDTEKFAPGREPELRRKLVGSDEGVLVFVPSRQDWRWKGSDRILRGFAEASAGRDDVRLVCTGWGTDLGRSQALAEELGISGRLVLLPSALSKGRLARYLRAADVVVDQVVMGSYGTSALEAMSCARPLVMRLDRKRFEGLFAALPPVCNAESAEDVSRELRALIDEPRLREDLGAKGRSWVVENHGDGVARRLLEIAGVA